MIEIAFGNLTKADGSALVDQNGTIVQATVFGPVDVSQSKLNYEEAVIELFYKPKISIPQASAEFDFVREMENIIKHVFKDIIHTRLFPRTSISIMVQEIHNAGSILSTTINAVCCALIDASVPMKCPVIGVSVTHEGTYELVFDNEFNIVTLLTKGKINEKSLETALKTGQDEAKGYFDRLREKVRDRFT